MRKVIPLALLIFTSMSLLGVSPPKTPKNIKGFGYVTVNAEYFADVFELVSFALIPHGYEWEHNRNNPGNDLEAFMRNVLWKNYGFFVLVAHGTQDGWMVFEYHNDKGTAEYRETILKIMFNAYHPEIRYLKNDTTGLYEIQVSPLFFERRTHFPNSIVFLDACYSSHFISSFKGVGSCFGWIGKPSKQNADYLRGPSNVFGRTGGVNLVNQSVYRNKTVGEAKSEYGNPILAMFGNSSMKLYNSPRIAGVLITQLTKKEEKIIYRYQYRGVRSCFLNFQI